jgi:hypothetical protein
MSPRPASGRVSWAPALAVLLLLAVSSVAAENPGPKSGSDHLTSLPGPPGLTPAEIAKRDSARRPAPEEAVAGSEQVGLAAPYQTRADCTIYPLTSGVSMPVVGDTVYTSYTQSYGYWSAVALRSQAGSDWDLNLYDEEGTTTCLTGLLASSSYTGDYCDVVVGDYNHTPVGTEYQESYLFSGAEGAVIEWDSGFDILSENEIVQRDTDSTEVVEVWDVFLSAGIQYSFELSATGYVHDPEMTLLLFQNPGTGSYFAGRNAAVFSLSESEWRGTYTPAQSDWYGLVVVNDDGGEGIYKVSFGTCTTPTVLSPGVVAGNGNGYEWFTGTQVAPYWMGFGMRSDSYMRGYDRFTLASGYDWPFCFGGTNSGFGGAGANGVIFTLGDYNKMVPGPFYFRTDVLQGHSNDVQWDSGYDLHYPSDPPIVRSTGPEHIIEVWDVGLVQNQTYNVDFQVGGAAELELFLFSPIAGLDWYSDQNDFYNSTGSCGPVTAWYTDYHGVAVVNHNGEPGTYQFQFDYPVKEATALPLGVPLDGRGVAWVDVDSDGDDDIFAVTYDIYQPNWLFLNEGGLTFADVTPPALVGPPSCLMSRWADVDNDGDSDVLLLGGETYPSRLFLLRNDGFPTFTDITPVVFPVPPGARVSDACWLDFDRDGLLDVALLEDLGPDRILLYRGLGEGAFAAADAFGAGINLARSLSWADFDGDLDPDLYLAVVGGNHLYRNEGGVSFTDVTGMFFPSPPSDYSYGAVWADMDRDLDLDLYVSNASPNADILWRNDGSVFTDVSSQLPFALSSRSCVNWIDIDNDWTPDLHVARFTNTGHIFLNNGGAGYFAASPNPAYFIFEYPGGVAYADPDADGDLDAFVASNALSTPSTGHFLRNDLCPGNHWLEVVLTGVVSNRSALGARVTAYLDWLIVRQDLTDNAGRWCQNSRTIHFGFRYRAPIDSLVIDWPSGIHQVILSPPIDTRIEVEEWDPAFDAPVVTEAPRAFALHPGAPNPFRNSTQIRYDLPSPVPVTLRVYNVAGRLVQELVRSSSQPAGSYEVIWDGRDAGGAGVGAGIYFVRLEAGQHSETTRVVRLR